MNDQQFQTLITRKGKEACGPASRTNATLPPHAEIEDLAQAKTFLPGLLEGYLDDQALPLKKDLAVVFVDIADSTSLLIGQSPETALAVVQHFSEVVTKQALAYCGDVKDYEGDGALLYFGSIKQAIKAAVAIRDALQTEQPTVGPPVQARLSLSMGEVIIGLVGTSARRSLAIIGPCVNLASRLLKHVPPGGIITPKAVVEQLQAETPELAEQFTLWGTCMVLKGFEEHCITAFHIPSPYQNPQIVAPSLPVVKRKRC